MRKPVLLALMVALSLSLSAQEAGDEFLFKPGVVNVKVYNGFIPSGATLDAEIAFAGLPEGMRFYLLAGGGFVNEGLARDPVTGDPVAVDLAQAWDSLQFEWAFGIVQGLYGIDPEGNELEAFALYRGRFRADYTSFPAANFPDARGMLSTSLLAGLGYSTVATGAHNEKRGAVAELSVEAAPGFVNPLFDFYRFNLQGSFALPLFDLAPDAALNILNMYALAFVDVDFAAGAYTPLYVKQSMGGRSTRGALGDNVRGYYGKAFDSDWKNYAALELRLVGPSLFELPLYPTLYAFADAGYYRGFSDSASFEGASGFIASAGGGFALDIWGFAQLGLVAGFRLVPAAPYYAAGDDGFFWGVCMVSHF